MEISLVLTKSNSHLRRPIFANKTFAFICFLYCALIPICDLFNISALQYLDDFLCLLGAIYIIYCLLSKKQTKDIAILFFLFLTGFLGNLISGYHRSIVLILEGFFFDYKFIFAFFLCFGLAKSRSSAQKYFLTYYSIFSLIMSYIIFPVCLYQKMAGAARPSFFAAYVGIIGFYSTLFTIVLFIALKERLLKNVWKLIAELGMILSAVTCVISTSSTGIVLIALFVFLAVEHRYKKYFPLFVALFLILGIFFVFLYHDKIINYFFNLSAPRSSFYYYSFQMMLRYFPFGTGFSLFGSKIAADYYSPVYVDIGWADTYILGRNSNFLLDTYYPCVFGEVGFLGTIILILLILRLLKRITNAKTKYKYLSVYLFVATLLMGIPFNFINSGSGISWIIISAALTYAFKEKELTGSLS